LGVGDVEQDGAAPMVIVKPAGAEASSTYEVLLQR